MKKIVLFLVSAVLLTLGYATNASASGGMRVSLVGAITDNAQGALAGIIEVGRPFNLDLFLVPGNPDANPLPNAYLATTGSQGFADLGLQVKGFGAVSTTASTQWVYSGNLNIPGGTLDIPLVVTIDGVGMGPDQILPNFSSFTPNDFAVIVDLAAVGFSAPVYATITGITITPELDTDGDGWLDGGDNCPLVVNPDQLDTDMDFIGNVCDDDDDNDSMPDAWELLYAPFLDPLVDDSGADPDNDGVINLQEYFNGTNPISTKTVKNDHNNDGKTDLLLRKTGTGEFFLSDQNGLSVIDQGVVGAFSDVENVLVSTGDFDGDGDADILTRGTAGGVLPGTFRVELTSGATVTAAAWMLTMSTNLNDVVMSTKDFNHDGKADVLLRNTATGVWTINYMDGVNAPTTGTLNASTDLCYTMKGDGDYDGNGFPDILLRHDACGGASYPWLVQTLQGSFSVLASGTAPGLTMNIGWDAMTTDSDFNGDDKADVLMRDRGASPQLWLEYDMNGVGAPSSSGQLPIATQSMWQFAATGDFNGDSKADLLIRSTSTGQWYIYLMNDRTVLSSAVPAIDINAIWSLQDLGDFNGDGKTDIMLRHDAGGAWKMFNMNGTSVASKGVLPLTYDLGYTLQNK